MYKEIKKTFEDQVEEIKHLKYNEKCSLYPHKNMALLGKSLFCISR